MKTFVFNNECHVYIANAETREEAIKLINMKIATLNDEWIHAPGLHEETRKSRAKYLLYDPLEFIHDALNNTEMFFTIEDNQALIYFHGNE